MLQRIAVSLVMLAVIIFGLQFLPEAADGAEKCPSITVTGLAENSENAAFSANITSLYEQMNYNWTISAGTINSGQGSLQIVVAAPAGTSIEATLEIDGIPTSCPNSASATVDL